MAAELSPGERIQEISVEQFCAAADNPFLRVPDPMPLLAKPFANAVESADILHDLSLLLSDLHLGRTMKVMDFGAGTCWLSRCLNQMGCSTVSVDPSPAALDLGQRLFREYPIIGQYVEPPVFLPFDGHRIRLDDESVDRIVCFYSFHHVPNQREVLAEFGRVLKPGGIAGFAEPGRFHSKSEQSQLEMKTHNVLENDVILETIREYAEQAGLSNFAVKAGFAPHLSFPFDQYQLVARRSLFHALCHPMRVLQLLWTHFRLLSSLASKSIFFVSKGPFIPDSRISFVAQGGSPQTSQARDMQHSMTAEKTNYRLNPGETAVVNLTVTNTGTIRWLHRNSADYATVKVGGHLYDKDMHLLDLNFLRSRFDADIPPGQRVPHSLKFAIPEPGEYRLVLDIVSEKVAWFDSCGSKPVVLNVSVGG